MKNFLTCQSRDIVTTYSKTNSSPSPYHSFPFSICTGLTLHCDIKHLTFQVFQPFLCNQSRLDSQFIKLISLHQPFLTLFIISASVKVHVIAPRFESKSSLIGVAMSTHYTVLACLSFHLPPPGTRYP